MPLYLQLITSPFSYPNTHPFPLPLILFPLPPTLFPPLFPLFSLCLPVVSLVTRLQRWLRKCLIRIRQYHYCRFAASIAIQTTIRAFLGKCTVYHRRRHCRGMVLQGMVRKFLARRRRYHRWCYRMCVRIQCLWRCVLGSIQLINTDLTLLTDPSPPPPPLSSHTYY